MTEPIQRLGVCSWSLQPTDPQALVTQLQTLGVPNVQLSLSPLAEEPELWGGAIQALQGAGLNVVSGMFTPVGEDYSTLQSIKKTGGVVPDEHWDKNLEIAQRAAQIAKAHGIPTVTFHAGFVPHDPADPGYQKLVDRLATLADVFAAADCDLLLETGQETADDLIAFLKAVDRPNLGVNFDPANMILYGKGDPIQAITKLMSYTRQVHIKDATATTTPGEWGSEVPVGTGDVDWPAFFAVLNNAGYTGYLVIEREAGNDRAGDIAIARDYVVKQLA